MILKKFNLIPYPSNVFGTFDADRKYGAIMSAHLSLGFSVGFISLKVNESISPEV